MYKNANLYQRYQEVCGIAAQVYLYFGTISNINNNASLETVFNRCQKMVDATIAHKLLSTKSIITQKSTLLL
ncbi:MAG: hypothetical protein GXP45_04730 [bacterium]|nr:hypothetical protein [bacterium]